MALRFINDVYVTDEFRVSVDISAEMDGTREDLISVDLSHRIDDCKGDVVKAVKSVVLDVSSVFHDLLDRRLGKHLMGIERSLQYAYAEALRRQAEANAAKKA